MGFLNKKLLLLCKRIFAKAPGNLELPRSLMGMPTEILLEIFENLCSHCSDIPVTSQQDLSNLSMTSKRLRAIVLPVLYHDASPRKMREFSQTIAKHKHLAARVHRFCNYGDDPSSLNYDVYYFINSPHGSSTLDHSIFRHHRVLGEVLAELTNAKHLDINVPCHHGYRLDELPKMSVSMESVTTLSLTPWVEFDLGQMCDFLAAMPCLETLKVMRCTNVTQRLPLVRIRSLTFSLSLIGPKSLQNLVDSCPILEYLDLDFADRGFINPRAQYVESAPLTWSQAQRILQSRRETLKHLRLNIGRGSPDVGRISREEYFGSFREFDVLESLWVLTAGFGSVGDRGIIPTFPICERQLVTMLPGSLTCIYFGGVPEDWRGTWWMTRAIQEGHFPRLKRVVEEASSALHAARVLPPCERLSKALRMRWEILERAEMRTRWTKYSTAAYA